MCKYTLKESLQTRNFPLISLLINMGSCQMKELFPNWMSTIKWDGNYLQVTFIWKQKPKNNCLRRPHHLSWSGGYAEQSSNPSDISTTIEIKLYRNKVIFLEMPMASASFPIPLRLVNHQKRCYKTISFSSSAQDLSGRFPDYSWKQLWDLQWIFSHSF